MIKRMNKKELALYHVLMKAEEANLEKRWRLNKTLDLLGKKKTLRNGEVRIDFENKPRLRAFGT